MSSTTALFRLTHGKCYPEALALVQGRKRGRGSDRQQPAAAVKTAPGRTKSLYRD